MPQRKLQTIHGQSWVKFLKPHVCCLDVSLAGVQKRAALFDLHNSPSFDERLAKRVELKTAELKDLGPRRAGLSDDFSTIN